MPQATIKLQVAPRPAAATRKPAEGDVTTADSSSKKLETDGETVPSRAVDTNVDVEDEVPAPEVSLPIAIAAAVLALIAFAIQAWTFIS